MANEIWKKALSTITAQASAAITADALSGGSTTTINRAGSGGNAEGAFEADIYVNVTSGPSGGDATAEIWMEASDDNSTFCEDEYCLSVKIPSSQTGRFHAGVVELPKYCNLKIKAVDYGFTASMLAVPQLPEAQ